MATLARHSSARQTRWAGSFGRISCRRLSDLLTTANLKRGIQWNRLLWEKKNEINGDAQTTHSIIVYCWPKNRRQSSCYEFVSLPQLFRIRQYSKIAVSAGHKTWLYQMYMYYSLEPRTNKTVKSLLLTFNEKSFRYGEWSIRELNTRTMPPTKNQFQKVVLSWLTSCCRAGAEFCQSCCPWPEVVAPCAVRNASTPLHCSLSWSRKKQRLVLCWCRNFFPNETLYIAFDVVAFKNRFSSSQWDVLPQLCQVDCLSFHGILRTHQTRENFSKSYLPLPSKSSNTCPRRPFVSGGVKWRRESMPESVSGGRRTSRRGAVLMSASWIGQRPSFGTPTRSSIMLTQCAWSRTNHKINTSNEFFIFKQS